MTRSELVTKYEPLERYLRKAKSERVPMTFREIETIIDDALPDSARRHRAWWSNNPSNSVITYAWLAAGYKSTEVNLEGETVIFLKSVKPGATGDARGKGINPVFGALKGMIEIAAGTDLTEPADPDWGRVYD